MSDHITEIAILDFGSSSTSNIAQIIRNLNVPAMVYKPDSFKYYPDKTKAIILSGAPISINELSNYSTLIEEIFEINQKKVPLLGVCFGHEVISEYLGGKVQVNLKPEHGITELTILDTSKLTHPNNGYKLKIGEKIDIWMDHDDSVTIIPENFKKIASTASSEFAIIADDEKEIYGMQFHPENPLGIKGIDLIVNFLNIAGVTTPEMQEFIAF